MNWREFRFVRKGKASLVWMIKQDRDSYSTRHGQYEGQMQEYSDIPGDKGKPGTKAYVDPVSNCVFHVEREIRKKTESGYVEYVDGKPIEKQVDKISFDEHLPKSFCSYKPQTSIKHKQLQALHDKDLARYSRKRDGQCHLMVKHTWGWEIYTRRIDVASERFPKHIEELNKVNLEVGTILVGEMICRTEDDKDDFKAISRICRSLPEEAHKLVDAGEVPEPSFIIFDMLFLAGEDLQNQTYDDRIELLFKKTADVFDGSELIEYVEYYDVAPDTWEDFAKERGWEGFVIVDGSAKPGDKFHSLNGKAKRPKGHYKLKPVWSEEVVVYGALNGTGKRLGGVGSVFVKQKHPDTGAWVGLGKVGSGFTDDDLVEIKKLCVEKSIPIVAKEKELSDVDMNREDDLLVCEIEFSERQPGTNKFRFPVFLRLRNDKDVIECYAQRWNDE